MEWDNLFANEMTHKGLLSTIYKQSYNFYYKTNKPKKKKKKKGRSPK